MTTFEKLQAHPEVQNVHPRFIAPVGGVMQVVATDVDGTIYLTDAGRELFGETPAVEGAEEAQPSRKAKKAVKSANTVAPVAPPDDDLQLD